MDAQASLPSSPLKLGAALALHFCGSAACQENQGTNEQGRTTRGEKILDNVRISRVEINYLVGYDMEHVGVGAPRE